MMKYYQIFQSINFNDYHTIITDWSGIFIEYALLSNQKAFLINTPKKIVNNNYLNYENQPIEMSLRNVLGRTYEIRDIQNIIKEIEILKINSQNTKSIQEDESVKEIVTKNFFQLNNRISP